MNKKKTTIFLTISTVLSWSLMFLFVHIADYVTDTPYIVFLFIVPLPTMLCINWYVKLLIDKIRKKEIDYTSINIVLAIVLLVPTVLYSLYDLYIADEWLSGLIGFFFLLFLDIPALLILLSSVIYRLRNKKS